MDEITKRALERMREMDSSTLNSHKRMMMETNQSVQSRAAMDAVKNMPDFSKTALNALKDLQLHQSRIFDESLRATPFLDAMRESERHIAAMFRHEHTAMLDAIKAVTQPRFEHTAMLDAIKAATQPRFEHTAMLDAIKAATQPSFEHTAMLDAVKAVTQPSLEHTAMLDAINAATQRSFEPMFESLKTFERMSLAQLGSIAGSARLAALSFTNPALESAFSASSFASTVAESVRSAMQGTTLDVSMFEGLEELIEEKVAELPRNRITAQGLYRIVFDIVIVFLTMMQAAGTGYQIHEGKRRENEQDKQQIEASAEQDKRNTALLQFLKQIAENTARLVPNNDASKYYVVERQVTLRMKPNNKAGKIVVLFPNQQVLLVQDNHTWIYIQYFDYLEGIPRYGWAMKKYLKRIR